MVSINRDYRLEIEKELAAIDNIRRERRAKRAKAIGKGAGKLAGFLYKEVKGLAKVAYKETKQLIGATLDAHARADLYERINPDARFINQDSTWKDRFKLVGRLGTMIGNSIEYQKLEKIASDNKITPGNVYITLRTRQELNEAKEIEQLAIEKARIKKRKDFEAAIRYQKRLNNLRAKISEKQADNKDAKDEIKKHNATVKNYNNKLLDLRLDNPNQRLHAFDYLQTGPAQKKTKP